MIPCSCPPGQLPNGAASRPGCNMTHDEFASGSVWTVSGLHLPELLDLLQCPASIARNGAKMQARASCTSTAFHRSREQCDRPQGRQRCSPGKKRERSCIKSQRSEAVAAEDRVPDHGAHGKEGGQASDAQEEREQLHFDCLAEGGPQLCMGPAEKCSTAPSSSFRAGCRIVEIGSHILRIQLAASPTRACHLNKLLQARIFTTSPQSPGDPARTLASVSLFAMDKRGNPVTRWALKSVLAVQACGASPLHIHIYRVLNLRSG